MIEEQMPVGAGEVWHVHGLSRQFFYVLSGEARVRTMSGAFALGAGSGVEVPAGVAHQIANTGVGPLRFLVVSAPSTRTDRRAVPPPS